MVTFFTIIICEFTDMNFVFVQMCLCACISKLQHNSFLLGTLNFVTLYSVTTLPRSDDVFSPPISIDEGFPFGTGTVYTVYVRKKTFPLCICGSLSHACTVMQSPLCIRGSLSHALLCRVMCHALFVNVNPFAYIK